MWTRVSRSLHAKLLAAHLVVVAVGIGTVYVAATSTAPRLFDYHVATMMRGTSMGSGMMGRMGEVFDLTIAEAFRNALDQALLIATVVALVAALGVSAFAAQRVVGPVRRLALAARRIAAGHYAERVPAGDIDELATLAESFNAMAAVLESSERRRLELLGDVAHELRTPISTLEGYLEGLLDGVVEPHAQTWALLREEAGRLRRLVEDLHELSRVEAQQVPLNIAIVSPAAIVEPTVARLAADFAAKGVALRVTLPKDLPPVRADRDRAIQVLTNLLSNALRYTLAPGEVEVSATRDGPAVRVAVRDTGVGIAPEHLPHVFERFYRIDKSRSRTLGGTGIGLTIARALSEAMGGRIWAASDGPGRGATFAFTLPVA
ncbi:MAG: HAMP domain-containing histidine kinase [Chloroflexi bacterium]|nr:HAMP domain-containing histidine kinase [Chloroflexota bacterium]